MLIQTVIQTFLTGKRFKTMEINGLKTRLSKLFCVKSKNRVRFFYGYSIIFRTFPRVLSSTLVLMPSSVASPKRDNLSCDNI